MAKSLETSRVKSWVTYRQEIAAYLDGGPETHFIKQLKRDIEATKAARVWHVKQVAIRRKRARLADERRHEQHTDEHQSLTCWLCRDSSA